MKRMARLAWFSPMPPARSGVAVYSAEVVAALRASHHVQVFVDEPVAAAARAQGISPEDVRSAHDFVWLNRLKPYDLAIYQLGNSSAHDFIWPYLYGHPGLAVLHDVHLHHARAAALLRQGRSETYRREFAESHPDTPVDLAELAIAGFDSYIHYDHPMVRLVVERSLLTAVHAPVAAHVLREGHPGATVDRIRLGHGTLVPDTAIRHARRQVRERFGIPADGLLFGVFGGLTPEKRISQILAAFDAPRHYAPDAHLLLVGEPAAHYDVSADVRRHGLERLVTITGYVDDDTFTETLAACDVSLNLRWPSARETSGPWIRALAAGCPTVTTDLWHTADVPGLDPRTWTVSHAAPDLTTPEPVTVKIDILDEDHSLRLALRRLARDVALRERLAHAGRAWWTAKHTQAAMLEDYERVIARALALPAARSRQVANSPEDRLLELLAPFGMSESPWSKI
jgi:glycosyltransferase involved in cell wall biosynthesis